MVESDRLRWLPPQGVATLNHTYSAGCPWDSAAQRPGAITTLRFDPHALRFSMPGLTETTSIIACGGQQIGLALSLIAEGRAFRLTTTDGTHLTLRADTFNAADADARIAALVCKPGVDTNTLSALRNGAILFMQRWDGFCLRDAANCAEAFKTHIVGTGIRG